MPFREYQLSWLAYLRAVVVFLFLSALGIALGAIHQTISVVAVIVALSIFAYQVLYARSVNIFTNDNGVWLERGIFPWDKGTVGVKWRDVEDAVVFTSFISWTCNSYTIRVRHRFNSTGEIYIDNVKDGRNAVAHINETHRAKLAATYQ